MQISRPNNKFENSLLEFLDKNLDKNLVKNFEDFLTVKKNSRSYQGFQEVTGICGKIQDHGKSFKIFYTGCFIKRVIPCMQPYQIFHL